MSRAAPPENERPERRLKHSGPQNFQNLGGNIAVRTTAIKRLLGHHGETWLFEVLAGQRSWYQVERGDRTWRFYWRSAAEDKFHKEAAREREPYGQGIREE